jgi:hypothetical protein
MRLPCAGQIPGQESESIKQAASASFINISGLPSAPKKSTTLDVKKRDECKNTGE